MKTLFIVFLILVFSPSVYASNCDTDCQIKVLTKISHALEKKENGMSCVVVSNDPKKDACLRDWDDLTTQIISLNNEIDTLTIEAMNIQIVVATNALLETELKIENKLIYQYWQTHLYTSHVH
ncbi:MAG: hypothetical protein KGI54_14090 [Pseudomonadota bacterium]|nr:hypothetical protein [Pseudomonadota bacterium]